MVECEPTKVSICSLGYTFSTIMPNHVQQVIPVSDVHPLSTADIFRFVLRGQKVPPVPSVPQLAKSRLGPLSKADTSHCPIGTVPWGLQCGTQEDVRPRHAFIASPLFFPDVGALQRKMFAGEGPGRVLCDSAASRTCARGHQSSMVARRTRNCGNGVLDEARKPSPPLSVWLQRDTTARLLGEWQKRA